MNRLIILVLLYLSGLGTIPLLHADVPPAAHHGLAKFKEITAAPGVSVSVMRDGELIWDEALGLADIEQNVKMSGDTVVRIGSISKTMTAVAAVRLSTRSGFDLDRPVGDYIEDFSGPARITTSRQLASHLSGVRAYKDEEYLSHKHYASTRAAMARFESDPLLAKPGQDFVYTSAGFTLLSATLAAAEAKPFAQVMAEQLWRPVGLDSTGLDDVRRIIPRRTRFYVQDENGELRNGALVDNSFKWAGGGMLSSTHDLAVYGSVLLADDFISEQEKALLFTKTKTLDGQPTAYGLGWYVDFEKFLRDRQQRIPAALFEKLLQQISGRQIIWHSGTAVGSVAVLMLEPAEGLVLALAVNKGDIEKETIVTALDLLSLLAEAEQIIPPTP